ncbi:MAG: NADP-dependent phosphogluconate dehydrogenase [Verrucomicrobiota bacterium]
MKETSEIGIIGLAVMGQNLALNLADHGYRVSVYNRTTARTDAFLSLNVRTPGEFTGAPSLQEFVQSLKKPRKIIMMVKAGHPIDDMLGTLAPLLEKGDIVIDGGNSLYTDTTRREKMLREKGIYFVGCGISGGEEGARFGPALMPGGDEQAWQVISPILMTIAAKVDAQSGRPIEGARPGQPILDGIPCVTYIGSNGAGHYVKMVHNGIEYGDMQLIAEAYHILRYGLGLSMEEVQKTFTDWNQGDLNSFLMQITAKILSCKDPETGEFLVEKIVDKAEQKGTGTWTILSALGMSIPASTISEAVFARCISVLREERQEAARAFAFSHIQVFEDDRAAMIEAVRDSLYASKICCYAQGFNLMRAMSIQEQWNLNLGEIAMIWRGGCIIRARFLQRIKDAYERHPQLNNLLMDPYFQNILAHTQANWRWLVSQAALAGIPIPAFSASLSYFDSYRSDRLPANLIQAQRDYFGAHGYERVDQPQGQYFHFDWASSQKQYVLENE